jgi:hypothetical protein
MTQEIRKATRKQAKLRLGISAPSGAGKTMGALLLAYGITKDWDKIGLIDTEEGSGELYVGIEKHGLTVGEFLYTRISGKFPPKAYVDGILAMENAGAEVIIVDSLTHAWAGTDGLLDKQGKIAAKSGNSYTAWRDVTPEHNALVNAMLQSKSHIIATMRSKVEYAMQKGDDGKYKIQKMGMAPIQREGMEYEFTTFFDIDTNHRASTTKDRTDLFSNINAAGNVEKLDFVITPETGEKLLAWLNKGVSGTQPLSHEVELLLTKITLNEEDTQDKFIIDNQSNLRSLPDDILNKIKIYIEKEKLS